MEKNIFNLIAKLDVYTQNRLKKWLQSPIHNQNGKLSILLENFLKQERKKASNALTTNKKEIAAPYDVVSELAKRVRDFLAHEYWQENAIQTNFALAESLYHLKLEGYTLDALKRTANALEKQPNRNAEWHFWHYQLLNLREMTQQNEIRKTGNTEVLQIAAHLDIAYFVKRLTLHADIISYNNVLKLNLNNEGFTALLNYIAAVGLAEEPLVALHIALLKCLTDEDDEQHFYTLQSILTEHYSLLNDYERRDRFMVAINYCVRRINKGHLSYYHKLFDLYLVLLENKVLLENGILQFWDYKNIISVGLQVKEYAWIQQFLYEYNEKLPPSWRENALTYNLAKLNFAQKNYAKVIELLQIVEYQDIIYTLDSRTMLLKTYYEIQEFEAFDTAAESFRIFLLRNKTLSLNMKKMYQNFLRFVKVLASLNPHDKKATIKVRNAITESDTVADKKWLLEKAG